MNNKVLFMIIDNQVKILSNSTMDHREWYLSLGLDISNYENIIRGFVMNNKIVFFKGSMFSYGDDVIKAAKVFTPTIRNTLNISYPVYCGIIIGQYDSKWEPVVQINENEITGFVYKKPIEKKEVVPIETRPIIEFKNNYEDSSFIKKSIIVTGIVLILTLIIKITLFNKQEILRLDNGVDVLLAFSQVGLLGFCIFGYIKKLSFTKYLSVLASVLMILTFDIFDIILGVLYFLFSVDCDFYSKCINYIKNLSKGKSK